MCECKDECCACCEEEVEEQITKEDIIQVVAQGIAEGECLGCSLEMLFELAYSQGKADLARESRDFYADVLEEEE